MLNDLNENQTSRCSRQTVKSILPLIEIIPRSDIGDTPDENCEYYCIGYVCVKVCYGE